MDECQPDEAGRPAAPLDADAYAVPTPTLGPKGLLSSALAGAPVRAECEAQPHPVETLVLCPPSPELASSPPCNSDRRQGGPSADEAGEVAEAEAAEVAAAEVAEVAAAAAEAEVEAEAAAAAEVAEAEVAEAEVAEAAHTPRRLSSAPSRPGTAGPSSRLEPRPQA